MIRRPRIQPFVIACVACLTLVGPAAYDLHRERAQAIETTRSQTAALARLLEENLHQLFQRAEAELDGLAQSPPAAGSVLSIDGLLRSAAPVVMGDGPSDAWRSRLGQAEAGQLQVDRLRRDAAGTWQLTVGRRAVAGAGLATTAWQAQLDLQPLQRLLDAADTRNNGFATLFTRDGWLVATAPRNVALHDRSWGETPM